MRRKTRKRVSSFPAVRVSIRRNRSGDGAEGEGQIETKASSGPEALLGAVAKKIRENRECPRDWTALTKENRQAHHHTVEVDMCPRCQGLFLDKREIERLTGSYRLERLLTKKLGLDSDSPLVCPNCGGLMETQEAGGVGVVVCMECKGIWLDAGELERLEATDPAEFRKLTPEVVAKVMKAREIRHEERARAFRALFGGLGKN